MVSVCRSATRLAAVGASTMVLFTPFVVLHLDVAGERSSRSGECGEEHVSTRLEDGPKVGLQVLAEVGEVAQRLPHEQAVEAGAPLLAHAAGLHAAGLRADPGALDHGDRADPEVLEMQGDREPDDAGADDENVARWWGNVRHGRPEASRGKRRHQQHPDAETLREYWA